MLALDLPPPPTVAVDFRSPVAGLHRPATDSGKLIDLLFGLQPTQPIMPSASGSSRLNSAVSASQDIRPFAMDEAHVPVATLFDGADLFPIAAISDVWLSETLSVIQRDLDEEPELRDRAEALAFCLMDSAFERRPQIFVDNDGIPAFAVSTDAFYINLTLTSPSYLTWFAVEDGIEHFAETVPFNGAYLPEPLARLLMV